MKIKLFCLITWAVATTAAHLTAQSFTTLYSFTGGSDGAGPNGLVLSGNNTLYGTTSAGFDNVEGTVIAINTDGTGFTTLYSFTGGTDGAYPLAGLLLSDNTLYGTASQGGNSGNGTVFAVNTDGTGFTNLHTFTATYTNSDGYYTNSDGAFPESGLILSGNKLYGTADKGGSSGNGTVFAVNTDGTGFTNLHSFTARTGPLDTNSDGAFPLSGLILSGNKLYGTADGGGSSHNGTVFAVNTDGTGFTTLHNFTASPFGTNTNSDGANPHAGLVLLGNTLYGTAYARGLSGHGTVFAVNTDGTGFTTLHSFSSETIDPSTGAPTNSDGALPFGGLVLSGNTLYGTGSVGGLSNCGTVFAINTDGTGFATLYSFTAQDIDSSDNSDGARPTTRLILSGNTLYGTASQGGSANEGTLFSLSLPAVSAPQLTITPSGANMILAWPATATGFTLQSTTNLGSLAFWTTNSPAPVVVNGQNVVTNPIAGALQFYRLSQ